MKRIFTLVFALFLFTSIKAQLLSEDFSFSGAILSQNGWSATAATPGTPALSTSAGLTYAGFMGSGIGNAANLGAAGEDLTKTLSTAPTTGSVYMTFMINVSAIAAASPGGYITGLTSGASFLTNYNLRLFVKPSGAGIDFGVARSNGTPIIYSGSVYNLSQTYLITCKYTFGTAAAFDDIASIFVHPTGSVVLLEPGIMSATFSGGTTGADATSLMGVFLRQGSATDGITAVIDGMRVATSWSATLPIELTSFTAKSNNSKTNLLWQTASEKNNSHFAIERSSDGDVFTKIGEVKGNGTSTITQNYQYPDATPSKGINYYRLRQVDFDGTESVSKTVSVNVDGKGQNKVKVYPTLIKDAITVELSDESKAEISVRDLTGRVILTQNTEGVSNQNLNLGALSSGLYILSVRSNDALETFKIYKQ
jgi:Secretion system C-terminal sorting domain